MKPVLARFWEHVYAIFRIMLGLLFFLHGTQKVLGWPPMVMPGGGGGGGLPPIALVAGVIELVTGLLIMIGLFTGLAAFIASGEMAAAYFMGHASQGAWWNPIANHGEAAFLFCFAFLYMAAHGSGIWSVDHARGSYQATVTGSTVAVTP